MAVQFPVDRLKHWLRDRSLAPQPEARLHASLIAAEDLAGLAALAGLLTQLPVREDPARAYLRQHYKAEWARRKLKGDFYDRAFKFATVRNPYDFAVSYFHYVKKSRSKR